MLATSFMRITSETPGQSLVLEGARPSLPTLALAELGAVLALIAYSSPGPALWDRLQQEGPDSAFVRTGAAVLSLGLLAVALHACFRLRGTRRIQSLVIDSPASALRLVESGWLGWFRRDRRIPLADLAGAKLEAELVRGGQEDAALVLTLAVRRDGKSCPVVAHLMVEGVNRREEVADLAFRLGAAAGFRSHLVARNDSFGVEVSLLAGEAPGHAPLPPVTGGARYAQDAVSQAARAAVATERVASFDPGSFSGPFRTVEWAPGRRVRLYRRPGLGLVAGALLALLAVGFLAMAYGGAVNADSLETGVMSVLFLGGFGAILLGGSLWLAHSALPCDTVFDWAGASIVVRWRLRRTAIPFSSVAALEMRSVVERRTDKDGRHTSTYWRNVLSARHRTPGADGTTRTDLAETADLENPDQPRRQMLPLLTDLASALGVEKVVS
jgi:hypothetical protein